jgi:hypothetical protein
VQIVQFGSEAAKYGLAAGDEVLAVVIPAQRIDPYWMTIPAFFVLAGICMLQLRRKRHQLKLAVAH